MLQNKECRHAEQADRVVRRMEGDVIARSYSLLEYNIPRAKLAMAEKITPGFNSPTVSALEDADWCAVRVMVRSGEVIEIAPTSAVQSGVVLYPVTVRLASTELPLRSGMTVNVSFPIEQRTDTLLVPFRAIETEGGQAYVTRVTASGTERVAVTMGLITDTQIEILSGINEGDVVTVYANPVQDTELMKNPMFGGGQ